MTLIVATEAPGEKSVNSLILALHGSERPSHPPFYCLAPWKETCSTHLKEGGRTPESVWKIWRREKSVASAGNQR